MDMATMYAAWRMYTYASKAYTTYKTAVDVYGTVCTVAATTGAVVGYVLPNGAKRKTDKVGLIIEKEGDWDVIEML